MSASWCYEDSLHFGVARLSQCHIVALVDHAQHGQPCEKKDHYFERFPVMVSMQENDRSIPFPNANKCQIDLLY